MPQEAAAVPARDMIIRAFDERSTPPAPWNFGPLPGTWQGTAEWHKRHVRRKEEETMEDRKATVSDVDALIALLDGRTRAGDSRIRVEVVDVAEEEGQTVTRQYHHGRCDIGSPWACGTAFDVLE